MLREDQNRSHRDTIAYIRRTIPETNTSDLKELDAANQAHIHAKNVFSTFNSDHTMVNLIGTWARLQRVIWKMDNKYGSRE